MARTPWKGETQLGDDTIEARANYKELDRAVNVASHWSVSDVRLEMGNEAHANRNLAQKILEERGKEVNTKSINSTMRNIQRWLNYEKGIEGKQSQKPSKAMQKILNTVGVKAAHGNQGATVSMASGDSGSISVNNYEREGRSLDVHLSPEQAAAFMANPSYEALAAAYGVSELHALGDASIDINWNE